MYKINASKKQKKLVVKQAELAWHKAKENKYP
jgi:hypothetical protein